MGTLWLMEILLEVLLLSEWVSTFLSGLWAARSKHTGRILPRCGPPVNNPLLFPQLGVMNQAMSQMNIEGQYPRSSPPEREIPGIPLDDRCTNLSTRWTLFLPIWLFFFYSENQIPVLAQSKQKNGGKTPRVTWRQAGENLNMLVNSENFLVTG